MYNDNTNNTVLDDFYERMEDSLQEGDYETANDYTQRIPIIIKLIKENENKNRN